MRYSGSPLRLGRTLITSYNTTWHILTDCWPEDYSVSNFEFVHRPDFRANAALFLRPPTPQRRTKQYSETDCQRNSEDQRCKRQSIEFQASDPSTIQCIAKYFRLETLAATTVF
jgi:hypothetical protein